MTRQVELLSTVFWGWHNEFIGIIPILTETLYVHFIQAKL